MSVDHHHDGLGTSGRRSLLLLAGLAALAFLLYGNTRSIWLDEAHYLAYAQQEVSVMLAGLRNDSHPPLYFLLLSGWIALVGDSEIAIRSLSWGLFVLTAAVVFELGRSLLRDRDAATLALILFVTSRTAVKQAQHAQMYALLACLVALSTLFLIRSCFLDSRRRWDPVLYGVFVLLGSFTHLWFFFVVLGQSLAVLLLCDRGRLKSHVLATGLALLPYTILWLPILLQHQIHTGAVDWMADHEFGPVTLLATFAHYYGGGVLGALAWTAFVAVVLVQPGRGGIARFGLTPLRRVGHHLRSREMALLLTLLGVSLLTPLAISQLKPIYRVGSYTIIGLIPVTLLLGSMLSRFADRRLVLILAHGLLLASVATFGVIHRRAERECTDRTAARYLLEHAVDGDAVIFTSLSQPALDYYLLRAEPPRDLRRISFPADQLEHPGWRSVPRLTARRDQLEREATNVVRQLASSTQRDERRIWLFYGRDRRVSDHLKQRLDRSFSHVDTFACPPPETPGAPYHFYDELLGYAPQSPGGGPIPGGSGSGRRR